MPALDTREQEQLNTIEDQTRGVPWAAFAAFVTLLVVVIGWMLTQLNSQERQIQAIQPQFAQVETQLAQVETDVSWVKSDLQTLNPAAK